MGFETVVGRCHDKATKCTSQALFGSGIFFGSNDPLSCPQMAWSCVVATPSSRLNPSNLPQSNAMLRNSNKTRATILLFGPSYRTRSDPMFSRVAEQTGRELQLEQSVHVRAVYSSNLTCCETRRNLTTVVICGATGAPLQRT